MSETSTASGYNIVGYVRPQKKSSIWCRIIGHDWAQRYMEVPEPYDPVTELYDWSSIRWDVIPFCKRCGHEEERQHWSRAS